MTTKRKVVAVHKNSQGDLEKFKLNDGTILEFGEMVDAIDRGEFPELMAVYGKPSDDGYQPLVIKSMPDGDPTNNLSNLPIF